MGRTRASRGRPTRPSTLSKSRFKEGLACPTRLSYSGRPGFGRTTDDDPFMQALADGGFQVGALARALYSGGVLVETLDQGAAVAQTTALLQQPQATVFEGAVAHGKLLARVDILVKRGDQVALIEVKAKSFDAREDSFFTARSVARGEPELSAGWAPYVADVGFQALAFRRAYPHLQVVPYLMLVDKASTTTVVGLHQRFLLRRGEGGRAEAVAVGPVGPADLGQPILRALGVEAEVAALERLEAARPAGFAGLVDRLAAACVDDVRVPPALGSCCRGCPYRISPARIAAGERSGFEACWQEVTGLSPAVLRTQPLVIDLASLPHAALIAAGVTQLAQVPDAQLPDRDDGRPGLSTAQRRRRLVAKFRAGDASIDLDRDGLRAEMAGWRYPLHMVDFETMAPALPFYRGVRPYAEAAFQFSHHTLDADGRVAHAGEWIETTPGAFPNFAFVRALAAAVGASGTIFRFHNHENTVLCHILEQLDLAEPPPPDRAALAAFIRSVTHAPRGAEAPWTGPRDMVDLHHLVCRYDLHPDTRGSNSLKYVLPAVLRGSPHLQAKYAQPIYGAAGGIPSANFRDMAWVRRDATGVVEDPYHLLAPIADGTEAAAEAEAEAAPLFGAEELRNGGAAMTAFARMQYTQMGAGERSRLRAALLRYCELDTLAMVMLVEYWRHETRSQA